MSSIWNPALVTFDLASRFKLYPLASNFWSGLHRCMSSLLIGVFSCTCPISSNFPAGLVTLITSDSAFIGLEIV